MIVLPLRQIAFMKVLLTGGLGFIGSHTALSLIEAGHELLILDNLDNSSLKVLKNLETITGSKIDFVNADITNYVNMASQLEKFSFDGVIHFAAKKSVPESMEKPLLYYKHNVQGLINVLELCELKKITNFIFSSSCTVYGTPTSLPVTEQTAIQKSATPYGNTKIWGEQILSEYASLNPDFKLVLLRYFNPVGAHPSALIGELPNGIPANLMPFITQTAVGIRKELKVYGDDYNTKDGTAIRDFIHVMDLADAHLKSLEWVASNSQLGKNIEVFNVGTGNGFTVLEVIRSFEKVSSQNLSWSFAPRREGDIEQIWADTQKVNTILNWLPKYTLDDMTRSAWEWQQKLLKEKLL
jgi:UDP-glucose 4-epimerase